MKNLIISISAIVIVIVNILIHPEMQDAILSINAKEVDTILTYAALTLITIMIMSFPVLLIREEIIEAKERKEHQRRQEEKQTLRDTYAPLAEGLTKWLDSDTLLEVSYHDYDRQFHINYETRWSRKCVRGSISREGVYNHTKSHTIGGYEFAFENETHEDIFDETITILQARIEKLNK